jgi:imidazolonepropionase-like amidohydrolase
MTPDSAPAVPDQTVVVQDGRIQAVGARTAIAVPPGVLEVDGTGKYLLPGLADMHVHLEYFEEPTVLQLFLANGVTAVRNMDGRPYILEWRDQIEKGALLGPAIYTAGPLLDGDPPLRPDNTVVRDGTEGRATVLAQQAAGYDFVKVYTNLSAAAYRGILATARELHMPVAGHVPRYVSLGESLASGQASIEHLGDYDEAIEADDSPYRGRYHWFKRFLGMPIDVAKARSIGQEQARRGVWTVPTLVQAGRELAPADVVQTWLTNPEAAYISPDGRAFWEEQLRRTAARMDDEDWRRVALGKSNRLSLVRALHEAGVPLLAGTDTPNPFVVPGFSLHEELKLFVDAGMSPLEALATATREAARFAGDLDVRGTVEAGKRADLLLLEGNPLDDVTNTRKLAGVVVRGTWLPREELTRMLDAVREAAAQERRRDGT